MTHRYGDCDEFGEGILEFKSGAVATLGAGWLDLADPMPLLVSGTEGCLYETTGKLFFQCKKVQGADGKQPWTYQLGDSINGSPAVVDGTFVVACGDGKVYAFGESP